MRLPVAKYYLFILCLFCFVLVNAQKGGYQKDSLQIKVYSVIQYKDSKVESIKITKTFCDYCSENQLNALKQEAWNRAYYERYNPKNRLVIKTIPEVIIGLDIFAIIAFAPSICSSVKP